MSRSEVTCVWLDDSSGCADSGCSGGRNRHKMGEHERSVSVRKEE